MENSKDSSAAEKGSKGGPAPEAEDVSDASAGSNSPAPEPAQQPPARRPFTSLSQIDSDLALARTLQEQERAYMMLRMGGGGSEYESSLSGSYVYEDDVDHLHEIENGDVGSDVEGDVHEDVNDGTRAFVDEEEEEEGDAYDDENNDDVFDVHAREEIDPSAFESDEAYARALQDAEVAVQMMAFAGINEWESEDGDENGSNSQDTWQEVDPDELSYEELIALGEVVGTESRGLSADVIASLPCSSYKQTDSRNGTSEQCVICRLDYEEGDGIIVLSCKHTYHSECIHNWLQINKVCPVCSAEVSTSTTQQEQ
ncbi:E3 ubiquitin ligase BIG BROTHER-related [Nymphaea thermarum]|nr:E3 ubiquitin ligase BIG BROTHER-related [Nymphaea thermarum]